MPHMKLRILLLAIALSLGAPVIGQVAPATETPAIAVSQPLPFPDTDYSDLTAPEFLTRTYLVCRRRRRTALERQKR